MANRAELRESSSRPVKEIISLLERVESSGQRSYRIFEDWLALVEATLDMLPAHARSIAGTGRPAEDSPEVAELWQQMRNRYNSKHRCSMPGWYKKAKTAGYFDIFAAAFTILLDAAEPLQAWDPGWGVEGPDIVGSIYMAYANPSSGHGQYFTPWNVAYAMSAMTIQNGEAEVHARLKKAAQTCGDPLADAILLTSVVVPEEQAPEWFHARVLPSLAPYTEPILVSDCCIGSGVMMLAAASQYPQWAITWGLVRFFGQDIDPVCVRMARINFKLYGLDSTGLKAALELSQAEIERLIPEPARPVYLEAAEAGRNGNHRRVKELADEFRENVNQYQQGSLFEL